MTLIGSYFGNGTLLTRLNYFSSLLRAFEIAEVETPNCLATSASGNPYLSTRLFAISALTRGIVPRLLPPLSSLSETLPKGTLRLLWPFTIPGAAASAKRHDCLVAQPGTLTPASHPMALPAASRSALITPPIDTLSPLAPDTGWPYDEVMSYVELNIKNGWATRPRHTHETFQPCPRPQDAPRSHRDLSHREKWSAAYPTGP